MPPLSAAESECPWVPSAGVPGSAWEWPESWLDDEKSAVNQVQNEPSSRPQSGDADPSAVPSTTGFFFCLGFMTPPFPTPSAESLPSG